MGKVSITETTHSEPGSSDPLDSPVWAALISGNREHAQGGPLAKRFLPDVAPFGAIRDRTAASFAALTALVPIDGRVVLQTMDALIPPPGLFIDRQAPVLQMVLDNPARTTRLAPDVVELHRSDVPEMMDLAGRTRPGPFGVRTIELGEYIGLRSDTVLAAMAGERMRFDRFVEISAVCVDPAYRGRGYAGFLVTRLAQSIQAQGLTPLLHVFADNISAVGLYSKLGFVVRKSFFITSLRLSRA